MTCSTGVGVQRDTRQATPGRCQIQTPAQPQSSLVHKEGMALNFLLLALLALLVRANVDAALCSVAETQCKANQTCFTSLLNYTTQCASVFLLSECTPACIAALAHLATSTNLGRRFVACTCGGADIVCVTRRTNMDAACVSDCDYARLQCGFDSVCQSAYTAYTNSCALALKTGNSSVCANACRASHAALNATRVGRDALRCTCNPADVSCAIAKANFDLSCFPVDPTTTPLPSEDCTGSVDPACTADAECKVLKESFLRNCPTFHGTSCSPACNASYAALIRNSVGRRFITCRCRTITSQCTSLLGKACLGNGNKPGTPTSPNTNTVLNSSPSREVSLKLRQSILGGGVFASLTIVFVVFV